MANVVPRPPWSDRSVDTLDVVVTPSCRNEPTILTTGRGFRRGAEAPAKSSLPFFVLVGLAVGLFAFGMMTFCLPDPLEKMAAHEAAAAKTFPPPPAMPIEVIVAPAVAPPPPPPPGEAPATVTSITPPTKPARAVRAVRTKKTTKAQVPSNPSSN